MKTAYCTCLSESASPSDSGLSHAASIPHRSLLGWLSTTQAQSHAYQRWGTSSVPQRISPPPFGTSFSRMCDDVTVYPTSGNRNRSITFPSPSLRETTGAVQVQSRSGTGAGPATGMIRTPSRPQMNIVPVARAYPLLPSRSTQLSRSVQGARAQTLGVAR
jgi:hypothetical protein